jgi:tRNA(fMet)-specific endonuclease VapC
MAEFLLDCNHVSAAIRKVSFVRDRIQQARKLGHKFGTCIPVLGELEAGIQQTDKPHEFRRRLNQLLKHVRLWPLDQNAAQLFGAIYNELRRQGRVLSQVDMILAALARQRKMTLLTTDKDFEALSDIQTENWVN